MRPGTAKAMLPHATGLGDDTWPRQGQPPHLDLREVQEADGVPRLAARDCEPTRSIYLQVYSVSSGRYCRSRLTPAAVRAHYPTP